MKKKITFSSRDTIIFEAVHDTIISICCPFHNPHHHLMDDLGNIVDAMLKAYGLTRKDLNLYAINSFRPNINKYGNIEYQNALH